MSNLEPHNRIRINATLRMGTQRQAITTKEPSKHKPLDLEVNIPQSLKKKLAPKIDPLLRPLQTNTRTHKPFEEQNGMEPKAQAIPQIDPLKKPARTTRKEYKLVEDRDIPLVLKDSRHNIVYQKLNCLGSVSRKCKKTTYC